MRRTTSIMLSFVLTSGLAASAAAASPVGASQAHGRAQAAQAQKPKPRPKAEKERKAKTRRDGERGDRDRAIDRDGHVRAIRDFQRRGLPPGLAKRDDLPPGLRRQLRERGALPPGLERHLVRVPDEWESRLPRIGRYERRYFAGDDLIVVDTRTNRIVALMRDVLR